MKKFLTLVLALVMVLAIAAPAMAFTSKAVDEESPYDLDIYLVEYENDLFFGLTTLPATDRGYAKNEVVAAVAELFVPEDNDLYADGYRSIEFSGENVTLNVADNNIKSSKVALLTTNNVDLADKGSFTAKGKIVFEIGTASTSVANELVNNDKDETYKWLFFAKVTDDDASLTFALRGVAPAWGSLCNYCGDALDIGDYIVVLKDEGHDSNSFTIWADKYHDVELFKIFVNDDYESEKLYIHEGGNDFEVVDGAEGLVFIQKDGYNSGKIYSDPDDHTYEDLMEILEDEFEGEFGFDYDLIGGVVDKDFFEDYLGANDLEATVDIAPWTAYVSIPDNIVVDPPKTGDAAGILGFVMIVLAAAAVVAVRKVRA